MRLAFHTRCAPAQQRLMDRNKERVTRCCLAMRVEQKQTLKFYQPTATRPFLKITVALPTMIPGLKCAPVRLHCNLFAVEKRSSNHAMATCPRIHGSAHHHPWPQMWVCLDGSTDTSTHRQTAIDYNCMLPHGDMDVMSCLPTAHRLACAQRSCSRKWVALDCLDGNHPSFLSF